jgi:hypothetical protein
MGQEAECTVRVGRKASTGKALLEGEVLVFRGDFRLDIPFDSMREVAAEGGALVVRTDDQEARFELGGPTAQRWARLIKEPKGLFEKLEVGPQSRVAVVDVTDTLFLTALRERTASVAEGRVPEGAPIVFLGAETRESLRKLPLIRARLVDAGVLWIVRPKGSKAISEADVLEAVREAGLVDTKVVAFSKTHTAHKCVIPVELRGVARRRPPILTLPPPPPGAKIEAPVVVEPKAPPPKAAKGPKPAQRPKSVPKKKPPARKAAKRDTKAGKKRTR